MKAVIQWVLKTMMKDQTGVMRTLPKKDLVDFNVAMTAEILARNGIDPNSLKNVNQVQNAINQIENAPRNVQEGIRSTKSAKVFDMEGKEIPPGSRIMGGKELTDSPLDDLKSIVDDYKTIGDQPPPGSRGGKDDIAAPFQSSEETIKNMIEAENKKNISKIKNRKMVKDAIDNMSPTFVKGDRKYNAQMVAEDLAEKRFGKDFYDLDQKQQTDLYGEALDGISDSKNLEKQFFKDVEEAGGMEEFLKKNPIDDDSGDFAQGGRAGFKAGLGKRFLELFKPKPKPKFDERRFREGPIDLDFLENIDKKDLEKFIRTRDTGGPGGYGMYSNFADMPAGLRAAELIKTIKGPRNEINYKAAELFLGKKLKGNETANELIQMLNRQEMRADGGRIGYKDGPKFDIQASGTKSGKQQIEGAPDGITIDSESLNAIAKADIPISQKIDLILEYKYGKGRNKIERGDKELFLDEGGFKSRDIGFGFNKDGEGIGGTVMYNMETGKPEFNFGIKKSFADGGRIGLKAGMTKRAFLKLMGGTGAAIGAAKSGIFSGFGKGAGKQVAKEVVEQGVRSTPPPYFFELANKIKMLGKPDKVTYADRVEIHRYRGKNGDEYELIEDLNTGDVRITKDKTGIGSSGDKTFDTIEDRTVLEYKKGDADVDPESGTAFKSADEYEEYKVEFDADGTPADATDLDAVVQKEIIEEATGDAPSIKKAGGGIARMLGE